MPNSESPVVVNPMAHEWSESTREGYAVCALCGYIENSPLKDATVDTRNCWQKKLDALQEENRSLKAKRDHVKRDIVDELDAMKARLIIEVPQQMGFWKTDCLRKQRAREEVLQHVGITPKEAEIVLWYMNAAEPVEWWKGYSGCRVCGALLGTKDMQTQDGRWVFPEKWQHYITEHNIRPTEEQFVKDAQAWAEDETT